MYKHFSNWMVPKSVKIIFGFQLSIGSVSKLLAFKKIQFIMSVKIITAYMRMFVSYMVIINEFALSKQA